MAPQPFKTVPVLQRSKQCTAQRSLETNLVTQLVNHEELNVTKESQSPVIPHMTNMPFHWVYSTV